MLHFLHSVCHFLKQTSSILHSEQRTEGAFLDRVHFRRSVKFALLLCVVCLRAADFITNVMQEFSHNTQM